MIIGNGDIATALQEVNRDDLLFFASGVSNSQETRESEYEREKKLLLQQPVNLHLVYFSSLAVFYGTSRYTTHKRKMEELVEQVFLSRTIVRLGNITWGKNPHTIINSFKNKLKKNEPIEIQDTYRYIIDKDEFLHWMKLIPHWSCEMNLTGKRMKVKEIVEMVRQEIAYPNANGRTTIYSNQI